jgi:hypothetical protein
MRPILCDGQQGADAGGDGGVGAVILFLFRVVASRWLLRQGAGGGGGVHVKERGEMGGTILTPSSRQHTSQYGDVLSPALCGPSHLAVSLLARLGKSLLCLTRDSGHAACSLRAPLRGPEVILPQSCPGMPRLSASGKIAGVSLLKAGGGLPQLSR